MIPKNGVLGGLQLYWGMAKEIHQHLLRTPHVTTVFRFCLTDPPFNINWSIISSLRLRWKSVIRKESDCSACPICWATRRLYVAGRQASQPASGPSQCIMPTGCKSFYRFARVHLLHQKVMTTVDCTNPSSGSHLLARPQSVTAGCHTTRSLTI